MTLTYKKMHVYTWHLREIFRKVKKTVLKAHFYIAFPAKAPTASHLYMKNKKMRLNKAHLFVFLYKCEAIGAFAGNAIYFWGFKKKLSKLLFESAKSSAGANSDR